MLSILNKLALQKELQNVVGQKVKTQQNKKIKQKNVGGARNLTRDFSHLKRMRYLCTTESTESID